MQTERKTDMGEVLFENQFHYNYDNMIQFARFIQRKALIIIAILGAGAAGYCYATANTFPAVMFTVFVALAILLYIMTPIANVKKQINYMHKMGKYPVTITCKFTEDEIVSTNTQTVGKVKVSYDDLTGIKELKTIYVLITKGSKHSYVTIEKGGFTKGEEKDFLEFINNKIEENKAQGEQDK